MSKELIEQLRDLANCRHDDLSIGYEAADRIEELERQLNQPVIMSEWQTLVQERDQLREQVKMMHKTLSGLVKAIDAAEYSTQFQMNLRIAEEALAATEPKE